MKKSVYTGLILMALIGISIFYARTAWAKPAKPTGWGECQLCTCPGGSKCYWIEDQQIWACSKCGHDVDHHNKK